MNMAMQRAARILVIDEDEIHCKLLRYVLTEEGYDVVLCHGVAPALQIMNRDHVHLVLLETRFGAASGLDVCRQLRTQQSPVPVLFLSACTGLDDIVAGFDAGADDYLAKPCDPRELLVRVRALLSRQLWGSTAEAGCSVEAGGYSLDLVDLAVRLPNGEVVQLTPQEQRVLQCLMVNAGRVVTRSAILQAAWGPEYRSESNQVDVYIRRIRRKIEQDPDHPVISTVYGLGYRLAVGREVGERREARALAVG